MVEIKWRARYSDGTWLDQGKNQYENIDRTKLAAFDILVDNELKLRVWLNDDKRKKLVYRRRGFKQLNTRTLEERKLPAVCLVGWHMKVGNESIQNINYVFEEDGHIEQAGKWVGGPPNFKYGEELDAN